ncbi:EamA-like transporter family-domain-containing protein [Ostreococcus tauri]|uniref:EamA-like transporter family-domain-containing protein n=2 Tax=Ostreococcus tauri TaxID=70448 RepID=A0A1Y5IBB7_OSTTA|nr:EamA-like transporter family-domain-containing protein [Ostreococcus tauri]
MRTRMTSSTPTTVRTRWTTAGAGGRWVVPTRARGTWGSSARVGSVDGEVGSVERAGRTARDALERVASSTGAERVISEGVSTSARDIECVGVGMEASCDVSGTVDAGEVELEAEAAGDEARAFDAAKNLALVSPFFLWGTSMVAMKEVLPVTSPMFVASVRLIPAGLILVAWAVSKGRPMPKTAEAWSAIAAFALVDATMFQGFLAEGLTRTSAGLGSVIIDSQPLTVAILASILFGETLGAEGVLGLVLGVLGLVLLELPEEALGSVMNGGGVAGLASTLHIQDSLWDNGEFWMLLAAQSMAIGTVMVRWVCKYVDPVMATGWHMALGGLPLLAYSLASEQEMYANMSLTGGDVASLTYASVFGGAIAYGAFFYFATKGSLTKLSSLTFLTPMFASALGYVTLEETLSGPQLVGAAVTLVGIYFVNTRAKEAAPTNK